MVAVALVFLLSASAIGEGPVDSTLREKRPNFVFILTDDQPYDYMGCTGNKIAQTPHLDRLADDGILFTNAHVTGAICTPSKSIDSC